MNSNLRVEGDRAYIVEDCGQIIAVLTHKGLTDEMAELWALGFEDGYDRGFASHKAITAIKAKVENVSKFIEIDESLDDLPLSPDAFRLMVHIKANSDSDGLTTREMGKIYQPAYPDASPEALKTRTVRALNELREIGLITTPKGESVNPKQDIQEVSEPPENWESPNARKSTARGGRKAGGAA